MESIYVINNHLLRVIITKCNKYIDDDSYVYKLCRDNLSDDAHRKWLVILQKLDTTETNELRTNITNKDHAFFRANRLKVIEIIDVDNPDISKKFIVNEYKFLETRYEVGNITEPDQYSDDINIIYGGGIHYFKTPITAFHYRNIPENFSGYWIEWYDNGQKRTECD